MFENIFNLLADPPQAYLILFALCAGDAILPASQSTAGRAGHGLAAAVGTLGEAIDASVLGRAARRANRR